MPTPEKQRRRTYVALFLAAWAVAVSLLVSGVVIVERFSDTNQRRARQAQINAQLRQVAKQDCLEIESLKKIQRDNAIDNYRKLDRNGRLLHITITPELRRTAREERDATLRKFAPEPCPRPVPPTTGGGTS